MLHGQSKELSRRSLFIYLQIGRHFKLADFKDLPGLGLKNARVAVALAQHIVAPVIVANNNRILGWLNFREHKKAIFIGLRCGAIADIQDKCSFFVVSIPHDLRQVHRGALDRLARTCAYNSACNRAAAWLGGRYCRLLRPWLLNFRGWFTSMISKLQKRT